MVLVLPKFIVNYSVFGATGKHTVNYDEFGQWCCCAQIHCNLQCFVQLVKTKVFVNNGGCCGNNGWVLSLQWVVVDVNNGLLLRKTSEKINM